VTEPEVLTRTEEGRALPYLVWRFPAPRAAASTAAVGGGLGHRHWVINAQVRHDYGRHDLDRHADELAREAGLTGAGITMFTAAEISRGRRAVDAGVCAWATVGLTDATWAAAPDPPDGPSELGASRPSAPGTINLVVSLPVALTDAALLNALCTATEAKCQALAERGVPGTGTPSDAVTVVCAATGAPEPFGGPRSVWGARLARAVHAAVRAGVTPS
jgi:adenosylcobinamide hydrolase